MLSELLQDEMLWKLLQNRCF